VTFVTFDHVVLHGELPRGIYRTFLRDEIADVTVGREHLKVVAEVFFDGFGFRRRFDDDEILGHFFRGLF